MKKLAFILTLFLGLNVFVTFFHPQETKADIFIVNAFVDSKVSKEKSEVFANVYEILADVSQRVIITVKLRDKDGNPLPGVKVELHSNRGEIDKIIAIKAEDGNLTPEEKAQPYITQTDENGIAYFRVSSTVPGEASFTVAADNIVEFAPLKITFLPLPMPRDITVSIEVPTFINPQGKIVLFRPSRFGAAESRLINTGIEIKIPSSLFIAIVLVVLLGPILLLIVFLLMRRIKKSEEKEIAYLKKEQEFLEKISNHNNNSSSAQKGP